MAVVGLVTLLVAQTYSVILFLSQKYCEAMTKSLWLEASVSRSMWHIPYWYPPLIIPWLEARISRSMWYILYWYCPLISVVRITYQSVTPGYTL